MSHFALSSHLSSVHCVHVTLEKEWRKKEQAQFNWSTLKENNSNRLLKLFSVHPSQTMRRE